MAKEKKKSAKEASNIFHNIMKASVQENPKPSIQIIEAERFYRNGQDYLTLVVKDGNTYRGEIYKAEDVLRVKNGDTVNEVLTACKKRIDSR